MVFEILCGSFFLVVGLCYVSHEKSPLTFHYTACLVGMIIYNIMVYYNY